MRFFDIIVEKQKTYYLKAFWLDKVFKLKFQKYQ